MDRSNLISSSRTICATQKRSSRNLITRNSKSHCYAAGGFLFSRLTTHRSNPHRNFSLPPPTPQLRHSLSKRINLPDSTSLAFSIAPPPLYQSLFESSPPIRKFLLTTANWIIPSVLPLVRWGINVNFEFVKQSGTLLSFVDTLQHVYLPIEITTNGGNRREARSN